MLLEKLARSAKWGTNVRVQWVLADSEGHYHIRAAPCPRPTLGPVWICPQRDIAPRTNTTLCCRLGP